MYAIRIRRRLPALQRRPEERWSCGAPVRLRVQQGTLALLCLFSSVLIFVLQGTFLYVDHWPSDIVRVGEHTSYDVGVGGHPNYGVRMFASARSPPRASVTAS